MERVTIAHAKDLFGANFIGLEELQFLFERMGLSSCSIETFIYDTLDLRWFLLKKNVIESSRAVQPLELLNENINFPTAILCVYTFFAYYYARKELLWHHDFVWCSDTDHNGDRIYVGKYHDVDEVNKNGFSIHRHLALRNCYGAIALY